MCAKHLKSTLASRCDTPHGAEISSSARGNTIRSRYRVLDLLLRDSELSVDRNCAGRNAKPEGSSVKGSSSVKRLISVVAEQVFSSEGNIGELWSTGTTGVQDLGMYRRLVLELGRPLNDRARSKLVALGQEAMFKFKVTSFRGFRWPHSSESPGNELGKEVR